VRATLLLDLYGTLVEPDWTELRLGRSAIAERAGVDAAAAERAWDVTHAARMSGSYGSLADDLRAVFSLVSGEGRPKIPALLLAELAEKEHENWSRGVRLHSDVMPSLRLLRSAGMQLAIVTNASAEAASVVDTLGLRAAVDSVFASCEVGVLKPDLLGVALRALGADPTDAILVDDEPRQVDGAARLGIGTILVDRSRTDPSMASVTDGRVVSDLRGVADLLLDPEPAPRP
jgi:HAD superfamily hydrolase (TIGR01509 family)